MSDFASSTAEHLAVIHTNTAPLHQQVTSKEKTGRNDFCRFLKQSS